MKRRAIKEILTTIGLILCTVIGAFAVIHPVLWLCREYMLPHMWEALVDAFNRFFGGAP